VFVQLARELSVLLEPLLLLQFMKTILFVVFSIIVSFVLDPLPLYIYAIIILVSETI
jgi:hypothetical protein